jgi:hypothetical protein
LNGNAPPHAHHPEFKRECDDSPSSCARVDGKPQAALLAPLETRMNRSRQIVRSGLAAVVILALGHFCVAEGWAGVFAFFRRTAAALAAWGGTSVTVSVWWLALVSALILTALGTAVLFASGRLRKRTPASAGLAKTEIFGIRWRWEYQEGNVRDLRSYCPKCDRQVGPKGETRHGFLHLISYQCECGHWRSKSFQCSQTEIIDRVRRTIQKHART